MKTFQLVRLMWLAEEREKHIWEDLYSSSWDEIIGRMYLLKAYDTMSNAGYKASLADFKRALALLAKDEVCQDYYARALNDKALVLCFLGKTKVALEAIDQALAISDQSDRTLILANRGAILVLAGAYEEALQTLTAQLTEDPEDQDLHFTQATCLLHMERYEEAITAYEKASAKKGHYRADEGLRAARLGKQPDWDAL